MGNTMPFVVQLALRSIAGFLIQIVPCAALCLMPFAGRLRGGRRVFAEPLDASVWWHMTLLPLMLIATFLLGYQLPPIPNSQLTVTLRTALCVTSVVLLWWTLRMALDASKSARRQARLQEALGKEQHRSQDLSEALACARERVRMLEEEVAAAADAAALSPAADAKGSPENSSHGPQGLGNLVSRADEPVVLMSAHQAVSLMPGDRLRGIPQPHARRAPHEWRERQADRLALRHLRAPAARALRLLPSLNRREPRAHTAHLVRRRASGRR